MGIGSFFSSLFQKKTEDTGRIREMNIEPRQIKRSSEVPVSPKPEKEDPVIEKTASESSGEKLETKPAGTDKGAEGSEKKQYYLAKKELYQYLNQTMNTLYKADQSNSWDSLKPLGEPSGKALEALDNIKEELPDSLWKLLLPFLEESSRREPSGLKPAFLSMLLPFYPVFSDQFGQFRYNTFLNKNALELYRRLTGRKYRLGYRNRYPDGQIAFEWKGNRYKVYNDKGVLLCDAVFRDGKIWDGYALTEEKDDQDPDWMIVQKGYYTEGHFEEKVCEYRYRKPIGL